MRVRSRLLWGYPLPPEGTSHTLRVFYRKESESSMKNPERLGRFAETALVLVRRDHVARVIVNANYGIVRIVRSKTKVLYRPDWQALKIMGKRSKVI
jgi:hypothetical protein